MMQQLFGNAGGLGWVAVKAVLLFVIAVLGLRLGERRVLSQIGLFDFAVAVAVGAIIGRTATSSTTSFATGAVALVTLLGAHRLVSIGRRHGWLVELVDPPPRVLVVDRAIRHRELAKAGLTVADLEAMVRQQGLTSMDDVDFALYEKNGTLSVLRKGREPGPLFGQHRVAARPSASS